jgi:hypothetical protein
MRHSLLLVKPKSIHSVLCHSAVDSPHYAWNSPLHTSLHCHSLRYPAYCSTFRHTQWCNSNKCPVLPSHHNALQFHTVYSTVCCSVRYDNDSCRHTLCCLQHCRYRELTERMFRYLFSVFCNSWYLWTGSERTSYCREFRVIVNTVRSFISKSAYVTGGLQQGSLYQL